MKSARVNSIIKALTALIGLGMFLFLCVFFVRELTKLSTMKISGSIESQFVPPRQSSPDSIIVMLHVNPDDFALLPFPAAGDTITEINDSAATYARWNSYFDSPRKPGETVPITFRHDNREWKTMAVLQAPSPENYFLVAVLQWLRFFIALAFTGVGLWAFFARPDAAAVRVFSLFCLSMTAMMIAGVRILNANYATFTPPLFDEVLSVVSAFVMGLGSFWLHLQLLFPRPAKIVEKHPVLTYVICYTPIVLVVLTSFFGNQLNLPEWMTVLANTSMFLLIAVGFVVMGVRKRLARDSVERRQMRLVFWGSAIGLGMMALLVILAQVFGNWLLGGTLRPLIIINFVFFTLLLTPLAYAYAFGRYRLLEVQGKLKRGTRYVLVTSLVLVVLFGTAYAIGELIVRQMNIQSYTPTLVIALILAMGVAPARRKLQDSLEDKFYPERKKLRDTLQGFLEQTSAFTGNQVFWSQLEGRLRESLGVHSVYPVLAGTNGSLLQLNEGAMTPFQITGDLSNRLKRERRPILVDELVASGKVELTNEETDWLHKNNVALILPLITHTRMVGFVGIGRKVSEEDYAAEELNVLGSLASQVALASENIRLLEENIAKRRLEEQMEIARRIQEGFLPRTLPDTPRLEVAAGSRFSLEVAGDYYDVITLEGGETVVAVGDVSGKGAGAALIMANLQASLRTAIRMGVPLSETIAHVNELIYNNTPPDQFITCFVGMYSPAEHKLTYVNAGHNAPIVARENGTVERLDATGLILGVLPSFVYETRVVILERGDIVLMFTDGVSEAMSADETEYGEDRIVEFARKYRRASTKELLNALERDVNDFCGRIPTEDDSTVVAIKRV